MDESVIKNKDTREALKPDGSNRAIQTRFTQHAVVSNALGDIIIGNPEAVSLGSAASVSVTIVNATSSTLTLTLNDNYNRIVFAIADVSMYFDSVSTANQWPNASVGMGTMPCMYYHDWGLSNNRNAVVRFIARNNTGSDKNVIFKYRWRYITNNSTANAGTNV